MDLSHLKGLPKASPKVVLLVGNPRTTGTGIARSATTETIVRVFKKVGRGSYSYSINEVDMHRYCTSSGDAWGELAEFTGASIVVVDKKYLRKEIKRIEKENENGC